MIVCGCFLEEVKSAIPFNEAIRFYLNVPATEKISGSKHYTAECPWCYMGPLHINPVKKVGWCLDCGNGGDVFSMVCAAEKFSLLELMPHIMARYDIKGESCKDECRSTGGAG